MAATPLFANRSAYHKWYAACALAMVGDLDQPRGGRKGGAHREFAPDRPRDAIALVRQLRPDVVLMDIRMPDMDGLRATQAICADAALAECKVLVVTTFDNDENIFGALEAGAGGFLGKDAPPGAVVQAIRTLHAGVGLVFPDATRAFISEHAAQSPPARLTRAIADLSDREREVFELIGRGLSNDEIGDRLFISNATVKTHINRCFAKLGARDRAQAVVMAYESGTVRTGDPRDPNDA